MTNINENEIGKYITQLIELDSFVLNDDRHFNSIAFLYNNGQFQMCPIFDNGAALLSDMTYEDMTDRCFCIDNFVTLLKKQSETVSRMITAKQEANKEINMNTGS